MNPKQQNLSTIPYAKSLPINTPDRMLRMQSPQRQYSRMLRHNAFFSPTTNPRKYGAHSNYFSGLSEGGMFV